MLVLLALLAGVVIGWTCGLYTHPTTASKVRVWVRFHTPNLWWTHMGVRFACGHVLHKITMLRICLYWGVRYRLLVLCLWVRRRVWWLHDRCWHGRYVVRGKYWRVRNHLLLQYWELRDRFVHTGYEL
jgi:hypothetical protein